MSFKTEELVKPIPEGFHTVTPYLLADDAQALIHFIETAFGGDVTFMMKSDDGLVNHCTMKIGDSMVMISNGTDRFGSMPCMLHLYVEDTDWVYQKAIQAGATSIREPVDEFYGDRSAGVKDAWGNQWWIATHIENVSDEEIMRREKKWRKVN